VVFKIPFRANAINGKSIVLHTTLAKMVVYMGSLFKALNDKKVKKSGIENAPLTKSNQIRRFISENAQYKTPFLRIIV
jgi:hypothetical protein